MPTFQFETMDSASDSQLGQIQAANADEAMRTLRSRGLFVVGLNEVTDNCGQVDDFESSVAGSARTEGHRVPGMKAVPAPWIGAFTTLMGVACLAAGLYNVIDAIWFRMETERAKAVVIEVRPTRPGGDVLEFTASGRLYRVLGRGCLGVLSMPSNGFRARVDVLFPPDQPEKARLADFGRNFYVPLIMAALGSIFTTLGVLILRRGGIPAK
jgi:hypothetical protein